jgi:predicted TPR repeat methyltransferase
LAGVSADLKGDRDAAIESYQAAIKGDPGFADAYEFRARALIETRRAGNLSRAVDDCTHALGLNPEEKGLREVRKVALQLDVASQDLPPDAAVDTSSVPLEPIEKRLNLGKFRR